MSQCQNSFQTAAAGLLFLDINKCTCMHVHGVLLTLADYFHQQELQGRISEHETANNMKNYSQHKGVLYEDKLCNDCRAIYD